MSYKQAVSKHWVSNSHNSSLIVNASLIAVIRRFMGPLTSVFTQQLGCACKYAKFIQGTAND
eukprot:1155364-Pelagomonas_calceolata.AAC.4